MDDWHAYAKLLMKLACELDTKCSEDDDRQRCTYAGTYREAYARVCATKRKREEYQVLNAHKKVCDATTQTLNTQDASTQTDAGMTLT